MSGFNAYDQALASVLNQAVVGGMPLSGSAPPGSDYSDYMKSGYGSSGSSNAKGMSLYCQNLPYSVTQDEIYELFPTSVNINILIGSDNRPQGTCIVYFGTVQQCEDALNQSRMNPMQIQGRNVRVNINNSDRNPNGAGGGYDKKPSYERGGRGGGGNSRARNEDKICITVFNLPFTVDEVEIQKKFTSSSRVYLKKGHDGRSKGIAVVHFTHPSARDIALMEAASIEMNGRFLRAETGDQSSGGGGGGRNHGNDSFSGGGERRGYGDRGGYRGGGRGGDRGGDRGGNDRGGGGRGGEERGQDRGGERGAPDRGGYDRGFDNSSGYGRRGGGPMGNPGGYQGNPGGGYQGGGGYQPRESYGGGGYNQRDQNQVRGGGGDPYGRPDGGRDFRSQPRGRGGFSRGGGGAGGGGRNDFNARERSPQDGKKPKYGMGSITSAIVKQLPTSGRPMSDSSSSGSE